jgi:ribosome-associated toxin RatA of RatAB toxin-antitoxin module
MLKKIIIFCAILMIAPAVSFAGQADGQRIAQLPEIELLKLLQGRELVTVDNPDKSGRRFIHAATEIKAPLEKIYQMLGDFGSYSNFMPNVEECRVSSSDGNTHIVEQTIVVHMAKIPIKTRYTTRNEMIPGQGMKWWFVEGDLGDTTGGWLLLPVRGGKSTVVIYTVYSDLGGASWILRKILEAQPNLELAINTSTAITVVRSLKNHIEKIK